VAARQWDHSPLSWCRVDRGSRRGRRGDAASRSRETLTSSRSPWDHWRRPPAAKAPPRPEKRPGGARPFCVAATLVGGPAAITDRVVLADPAVKALVGRGKLHADESLASAPWSRSGVLPVPGGVLAFCRQATTSATTAGPSWSRSGTA
jgi:hypothetical protein